MTEYSLKLTDKVRAYITDNSPLPKDCYVLRSPPDAKYNCHAWGVGVFNENFDPFDKASPWYSEENSSILVEAMVARFKSMGFSDCDTNNLEYQEGIQKIALYVKDGEVHHTARLLKNNSWASKMCDEEDIEHQRLDSLEVMGWGVASIFLKRDYPHPDPKPLRASQELPFKYRIPILQGKLP